MYSYEDRIRAIKLYIKLGKRIRPTIRRLGYPTKNALMSWYREYEQSRALQAGYVRSRQRYSDKQPVPSTNMHCSCQAGLKPKLARIASSDEA